MRRIARIRTGKQRARASRQTKRPCSADPTAESSDVAAAGTIACRAPHALGEEASTPAFVAPADATGAYVDAKGSAGSFVATIKDLQNWYKKTKQLMTDKADVNSLSDAAFFLLNSTNRQKP